MDLLVRCLNDEDLIDQWLTYGIADEDIKDNTTDLQIVGLGYTDDDSFYEIGRLFLDLLYKAKKEKTGLCMGRAIIL